MRNYDPPIPDQAWLSLPFPFLEMQGAAVDTTTTDTSQVYEGFFCIDRHPTDDKLFSPVLVISDLPTANWATHVQLRVRLAPGAMSRLERQRKGDNYTYTLSIPLSALGYVRLPDQLRA
jgi:hypothetical protein